MFDSVDLELALSDLYDVGVKDDTLALLYKANKEAHGSKNTKWSNKQAGNLQLRPAGGHLQLHPVVGASGYHWQRVCGRRPHLSVQRKIACRFLGTCRI